MLLYQFTHFHIHIPDLQILFWWFPDHNYQKVTVNSDPPTTQSERDLQAKHLNPDGKEILKDRTKDRDEELKLGTQQPEGRMEIYVSRAPRSLLEILMDIWLNNPTAGFLREILPRMKISQAWIQSHIWFFATKTPMEYFKARNIRSCDQNFTKCLSTQIS